MYLYFLRYLHLNRTKTDTAKSIVSIGGSVSVSTNEFAIDSYADVEYDD